MLSGTSMLNDMLIISSYSWEYSWLVIAEIKLLSVMLLRQIEITTVT